MYKDVVTCMRELEELMQEFLANIGLHQGSALSPYLVALVIDELMIHI